MVALEGKILDRYTLRRLVGRGGMANVYEAQDLQSHQNVAVKVFKREDEELLRRFIREARLMASLHHEHLLPILDSGQSQLDGDTRYYIVMPFLDGGTLRARIRRSPLSLAEACYALRAIAGALDYIHSQGIIHRDIKASNVLLDAHGECYLTDFGIARVTGDVTQLTSTGDVLGTVDYVAPELYEANRRADARSDLYSLGVLLFEMVTGRLPFPAENQLVAVSMHMNKRPPSPRSIAPHISPQVERVIFKALEKKPEQRYASAAELVDAFCGAVSAGNKNGLPEHSSALRVGQPEAVAPIAGAEQALPSPLPPAPAVNSTVRPSPLAHATEGYEFIVPQHGPDTTIADADTLPPPSSEPASPRPPYRRRRFAVVLALLALILLGASLTSIIIPRANNANPSNVTGAAQGASTTPVVQTPTMHPTTTPNLTATTLAAQAATATAQAQQTATAIAGVTATAQAQASATAGVIQTATVGTPGYQDALNNANNSTTANANWDQDSNCYFAADGYHVIEGSNLHGCKESAYTYRNAAITVNVRIRSGQSGGLFFRINTDLFNRYAGYLFEIDSTGRYRISVSGNYSSGSTPLQDWTTSSALKQGNTATNTLQVIAQGSNLFFYANGIFLVQLKNAAYTSGVVAFLARSNGTTTTEVVYTNLKVYPSG
ncbi:MAG TPA: serine/threonine-protein kinase [Ktedonobacteraceae bacterium]|nr:serine/threonine-protein kinase [Ktedonobacteraceae bacterium]